MKKLYFLFLVVCSLSLNAQTTINYTQQIANYSAFFTDSGGNFDNGADEFGMWANGGGAKQSVAWRNFTEDGTTSGTLSTMDIGDSFTITISATQASFGVIGLALLSSPSSSSTWVDRINNYAVQVNLNGNSGANDPWEVVSSGGTIDASSIGGSTSYADFKFTFTLDTATTMTVSINDGAETFSITLNNTDITGYSVYITDDWNGSANANIFWKQLTEYTYATTLGTNELNISNLSLHFYTSDNNTLHIYGLQNRSYELSIYDTLGRFINNIDSNSSLVDISYLKKGIYFAILKLENGNSITTKFLKQ